MSNSLDIQAVSFCYGSSAEGMEVFSELNFKVRDGECVAFVGPSGCGKSSLLNIIAGHRAATSGTAIFNGKSISGAHPERQLMQQHDSLLPHLTVSENLELALTAMEWTAAPILNRWAHAFGFAMSKLTLAPRKINGTLQQRIYEALAQVGLSGFGGHYPKALSGGMRRRAELARCLLANGKLILLDEPFTGLDALSREQMHELIERIWIQRGKMCVIVTHDWNEAVVMADRIFVLSPRPAKIVSEVRVNLPRPRDREVQMSTELIQLTRALHETLRHESR